MALFTMLLLFILCAVGSFAARKFSRNLSMILGLFSLLALIGIVLTFILVSGAS